MKDLYRRYSAAMVAVITTDHEGDEHIGSAFHVGEGSFVTARHVTEGQARCRIEIDSYWLCQLTKEASDRLMPAGLTELEFEGLPHPDPAKDVAVFSVPQLAGLPAIPLGGHLDDWIADQEFVLNEVLVMGFPPVPLAHGPVLVAAIGQVNAVVDLINVPHVHFIVSVPPKGGFSGGVVLSEWDFALGVVTSSLVKNHASEELGYLTVLTTEPILECLGAHRLMPKELALMWDGLFTAKESYFGRPERRWAQAWVRTDRDGHRTILEFACPAEEAVQVAIRAVADAVPGIVLQHQVVPNDVHQFALEGDYDSLEEPLRLATEAASAAFVQGGFLPVDRPVIISRTLDEPWFPDLTEPSGPS